MIDYVKRNDIFGDAEDLVDEPSVFEPGVQAGNPR